MNSLRIRCQLYLYNIKTYIVERFAEENYEEIVEINFKQIPSAMDIFSGDLKVDNMVMAMSVFDDGKCKSIR